VLHELEGQPGPASERDSDIALGNQSNVMSWEEKNCALANQSTVSHGTKLRQVQVQVQVQKKF
jgi:hypothetical protein